MSRWKLVTRMQRFTQGKSRATPLEHRSVLSRVSMHHSPRPRIRYRRILYELV